MSTAVSIAPHYEPPAILESSHAVPYHKDWITIAMGIVLVIAIFGSAAAYCWVVCRGHVSSCYTAGNFWSRSVYAVCRP